MGQTEHFKTKEIPGSSDVKLLILRLLCVTIFGLGERYAFGQTTSNSTDADQETAKPENKVIQYLSTITNGYPPYNQREPPEYVYHFHVEEFSPVLNNATAQLHPWAKMVVQPLFISSMSMKRMEFTVDLDIDVSWEDGRLLKPDANLLGEIPDVIDIKELAVSFVGSQTPSTNIWRPPIKWVNCIGKKSWLMKDEIYNMDLALNPWMQRIFFHDKVSLAFFCRYNFSYYPFEEQQCAVQLNYEQSKKEVDWITELVSKDIDVPPEFEFVSLTKETCPDVPTTGSGRIQCVQYVFKLQRRYAQHVLLLFLPSLILVCLSWITFWLKESAAPPKLALGLSTLLILAILFTNAQKDLPTVTEVKAIDVWIFFCMFMVFATLVEFIVANYCYRRTKNLKTVKPLNPPRLPVLPKIREDPTPKYAFTTQDEPKMMFDRLFRGGTLKSSKQRRLQIDNFLKSSAALKTSKERGTDKMKWFSWATNNRIDRHSRIIFPVVFLIFNIVFWAVYLS